jgi:putative lipoprotein
VIRIRATLLALVLAWTGLGGRAAPARAEPTPAAGGGDEWFGHDKALHFGATFVISAGGYGAAALLSEDVRVRLAAGAVLGIGAGAGKELWDLSGHGDASWRDFTWDVVGTAAGLAFAAAIDCAIHWTISRLARRAPLALR